MKQAIYIKNQRKEEERGNRPEGHRYLSLSSFKEAPPQLFPVCKTTNNPSLTIVSKKMIVFKNDRYSFSKNSK